MDTLEGASTVERLMIKRAEQRGIPITGSLELLPLCNLNCDMCYVRLSKGEMESQGRMRSGKEWLELGEQMAHAGTLFLLLTGGEPLLHPDFKDIYLGLKKLGMILTINTNGTLIDEKWVDFFGRNKPRRINITLYGADEDAYEKLCHYRGGFERVVRAVDLLRQRDVDVKLGGSITPANVNDIPRMVEIANKLGVPIRMDTYMMPAARERSRAFDLHNRLASEKAARARIQALRAEMGETLFAQYREQMLTQIDDFVPKQEMPCPVTCHAGMCSFTVNWQGQMRPCVVLREPAVSVFELGFSESWRKISEKFKKVRYCAKCSACRLRPVCRTCAAAALLETGDYLGIPEYLCRFATESERLLRISREEDAHE